MTVKAVPYHVWSTMVILWYIIVCATVYHIKFVLLMCCFVFLAQMKRKTPSQLNGSVTPTEPTQEEEHQPGPELQRTGR